MNPKFLIALVSGVLGVLAIAIVTGVKKKDNCVQYKKVETTVLQGTVGRTGLDSICICKFDPSKNELVTLKLDK